MPNTAEPAQPASRTASVLRSRPPLGASHFVFAEHVGQVMRRGLDRLVPAADRPRLFEHRLPLLAVGRVDSVTVVS
eukprot:14568212-Alexandrium_andersonii.AAC.1